MTETTYRPRRGPSPASPLPRRPIGWRDPESPRARVRTTIDGAHPHGAHLGAEAAATAATLVAAIRDDTTHAVAAATDTASRGQLVALVVALAAMVPADVDPDQALAWVDLPCEAWPEATVSAELARFVAGARDATALAGGAEHDRRAGAAGRPALAATILAHPSARPRARA